MVGGEDDMPVLSAKPSLNDSDATKTPLAPLCQIIDAFLAARVGRSLWPHGSGQVVCCTRVL